MKFTYCPYCGDKLVMKSIGDEGIVPFCDGCNVPHFDIFPSTVLVIVENEEGEICLLRQGYVSDSNWVLVAGYIALGENAETTAIREVQEEVGLVVNQLKYLKSFYHDRRDMLLLGFVAMVEKKDFELSVEVDRAKWHCKEEVNGMLKPGSIGQQLWEFYIHYTETKVG